MLCREIIIIAIFYMLRVVVLAAGFVPITSVVLTAKLVLTIDILITFEGIVIVLTAGFVSTEVLFIVGIIVEAN